MYSNNFSFRAQTSSETPLEEIHFSLPLTKDPDASLSILPENSGSVFCHELLDTAEVTPSTVTIICETMDSQADSLAVDSRSEE